MSVWDKAQFVLDENQSVSFTPRDVSLSVYILLMGGVILIGTIIAIVFNFFGTPISLENKLQEIDWRSILKQGSQAIVVAGVAGSLVTAIIVIGLMVISPLIFTNFIVAAFLGNSITLGYLARRKLKSRNNEFSYTQIIRQMLKQRTLSKDIGLGVSVGIILVTLIYATIGNYFTLTFSTASIRLLYLPLYIVLFAITFFFYEVYRHTMEAQMGSKIARTILFGWVIIAASRR